MADNEKLNEDFTKLIKNATESSIGKIDLLSYIAILSLFLEKVIIDTQVSLELVSSIFVKEGYLSSDDLVKLVERQRNAVDNNYFILNQFRDSMGKINSTISKNVDFTSTFKKILAGEKLSDADNEALIKAFEIKEEQQ